MNDAFTLLCASNVVEAQRVKALLEENNIFPIIKDEGESARLAGFGSAPMMQQVRARKAMTNKRVMRTRMTTMTTTWNLQRFMPQPLATTTGCTEALSLLTCLGWRT